VTWALTWVALLAVPLVLAAKVRFPFPDPLFSSTSPSWLTSPSAPFVEAAAAGAWLAWMAGLVREVRRHRISVLARSSTEPLAVVEADELDPANPQVEQLRIVVAQCLTSLGEGPLQLGGSGAKAVLPFACAEWIEQHHDSTILVSDQLGDDLAGLDESLGQKLSFGDGGRLLRMVEGELLGRKRHALETDLDEHESGSPHSGLAPQLVIVASVPRDLQARWHAVLDTAHSVGIHVLSVETDLPTTSRLDIEDFVQADYDTSFLARTTSLGTLPAVSGLPVLAPLKMPALDIGGAAILEGSTATSRPEDATTKPIRVQVLGPYRIWAHGAEISTGLRSASRELLAWYLLQGEGASAAAAVDALWPDSDPLDVTKKFWRALGDLRSRLRSSDGMLSVSILVKSAGLYRPSFEEITCDLWSFQNYLERARRAKEPELARDLLHSALDLHKGELFAGADYPWALSATSSLKRQAHDGALRLAQLEREHERTDLAISVLERAIALEPYAEDFYGSLIDIRLSTQNIGAATSTYKELSLRLAELGETPSAHTRALLEHSV